MITENSSNLGQIPVILLTGSVKDLEHFSRRSGIHPEGAPFSGSQAARVRLETPRQCAPSRLVGFCPSQPVTGKEFPPKPCRV